MSVKKNLINKYSEAKRIIQEAQHDGQLVLFIGAGASIGAGMPSWSKAVSIIAEKLGLNSDMVTPDDYLRIPQFYYNSRGKKEYTQLMQDIFLYDKYLHKQHVHDLIIQFNTQTIITTNYDKLIEKAAEDNSELIHVISKDSDLPYRKSGRELIKMHGDFENDNFVLREDDYLSYSSHFRLIENYIKSIIGTKVVLFIGYSFNDPDIRHIFSWAKDILHGDFQPAYLINTRNAYDINEDEYYRNLGINILYSSIQLEDRFDKTDESLNLKNMLNWMLSKDAQNTKLDTLYDSLKIFDGLDYAYGKYIETELNSVGIVLNNGYVCSWHDASADISEDDSAISIVQALAYERYCQSPESAYVLSRRNDEKIRYTLENSLCIKDADDKLKKILEVLEKTNICGINIELPIDETHPLLEGESSSISGHDVYLDFDRLEMPEWYEQFMLFDEAGLRLREKNNSSSLNDSFPDLYIEQASIHLSFGDYLAAYNCMRMASKIFYKNNDVAKYYISETNRYNIGLEIKRRGVIYGIPQKDVDTVANEIESIDFDRTYKSLPDIGGGKSLLKDISDFKVSFRLFHDAYSMSEKVREEANTEYSLFGGIPAFAKMQKNIKDFYDFETINHILLDDYYENIQIYRLYFYSILESVLTPDMGNSDDHLKTNNVHSDCLSSFEIFLLLRYENISDISKRLKRIDTIPVSNDGYDYMKNVLGHSEEPNRGFYLKPVRPFWKLILFLSHTEYDKELFVIAIKKMCKYINGIDYREHRESIIKLIDSAESRGLIDKENVDFIAKILEKLLKHLINGGKVESSSLAYLAVFLAHICQLHNCELNNSKLINELLMNEESVNLCIDMYPKLGKTAQRVVSKKFKVWHETKDVKDYKRYCLLVSSGVIKADDEMEHIIETYCIKEKERKSNEAKSSKKAGIRVMSYGFAEDNEILLQDMCNLYLADKIADTNSFTDTVNKMDHNLTKWLIDLNGFDYSIFDIKWLEGCSRALLEKIAGNENARRNIANKFREAYMGGKWDEKTAERYFKYFAENKGKKE